MAAKLEVSVNAKEVSKALSSGNDFATVLSLIEGLNKKDLDQLTACLPNQRSPLHYACQHGRVDIAHKLITKFKYSTRSRDKKGCTPLHTAAEYGQLDTLKYLTQFMVTDDVSLSISSKLSVSLQSVFQHKLSTLPRDLKGNTPWHTACMHGNLDIVKFFTRVLGCDPRDINNDGMSCLHLAAQNGDLVLIRYLVEVMKCDPNCISKGGRTPLHYASENGHLDVVKYLVVTHHCDPQVKDDNNVTPLHLAAQNGNLLLVTHIIQGMKCDPNSKDNQGEEPLHTASRNGHLDVVKYLVDTHHCDPQVKKLNKSTPLHLAALNGHLSLVKFFIDEMKCNPECTNIQGLVPLHHACEYGHLDVVKYLVNTHHCDPQVKTDNNVTPLHLAAQEGHLHIVKWLVENVQCDPNCRNNQGSVPLHVASRNGHLDVVKYLVDTHHCDPQVKDDEKRTPFHLAACSGHITLVKYLIEYLKCDPNCKDNKGEAALHVASRNSHLDVVKYLVDTHHCDPQVKTDDNWTPLHIAARNGHLQLVKYFIEDRKCDPNCKSINGKVPLHEASWNGHLDVVKYLVDTHHCDPQVKNDNNVTPLHLAARKGHLVLVKYFIKTFNCDPNCETKKGKVPLHAACLNGNLDVVKYLVDTHHCDPQVNDDNNVTPLHDAAGNGHIELVKCLIEDMKCDPNCRDNQGKVPLHYASENGHLDVVKYIAERHHCDPQVKETNESTVTPLHLAACNGHLTLVKYLIDDQNCDPNCKDSQGWTPLHYASCKGHLNIVKYLVDTRDCNLESKNKSSRTPLNVANYNAKRNVASCLLRATTKKIIIKSDVISPCITLHLIGDSGTGKSTLVKALSSNSGFLGGFFPVGDVEPHTAGIVPSMLQSDVFGEVKVYDFACSELYYASHKEVLKQHSQPLILFTVNISMSIEEIEKQLTYWTTLISSYPAQCDTTHILIIGSHSDKVKSKIREEKEARIENIIKMTTLNYHGFVPCDCRYSTSDSMNYLRQKIDTISTAIRQSLASQEDVATNKRCAALMIYLKSLRSRQVTYTVSELHKMISSMSSPNSSLASLQDQSQLILACQALSSSGHLLFLSCEERAKSESVIVLDETFVLSKVYTLLSQIKSSLKATENGILNEEHLKNFLSNLLKGIMVPEVAMKFLVSSQFCTKIASHQLLNYKAEGVRTYYFFPSLTLATRPHPVDLLSSIDTPLYTWSVKCAKRGQFFTPKFTHTLFIQLVQNDADKIKSTRFTVWKSGILLVHSSGTRSIIEVTDDFTQLDFVTKFSIGHEFAMVEQRSTIISLIKALVRKVCPSVEVTEFLPYPQDSYPNMEHTTEIPLSHVASSVTNNDDYAVAQDSAMSQVPLSRLLFFESFRRMKTPIIRDIFTHQNSKQPVSPSTLTAVAEALKKQNCGELPGNLQEIAHNPQLVINITYSQLYRELHKYTIFPEGNLCVS